MTHLHHEKVDFDGCCFFLQAQRLLTFLASDADSESGCSEEASNTDSGRGTINEEQEPPAKGEQLSASITPPYITQDIDTTLGQRLTTLAQCCASVLSYIIF